ncbi:MAG: GTPase domain-containing protein [Gammaproteobacteria bacterium]|nr:GTPase domain-containing protein [Gammaproteobacteria bacterium]
MGQMDLECLSEVNSALRDVQFRYTALQERVENQQAYLLILGPLKSGKSTLMNAISGTYVSEVSSLPAYPALVYVKNGEQPRYQATDYKGETREFVDGKQLCSQIQIEHQRLADALLEVERKEQDFEPTVHYPEAIKRVNVELPAEALASSGTVLIDTPGLYSRMKFGYEQVTREFRNTAACAIFVVKGDNLFFEKVFEEFEDLLKSFNRIFLVANIDKSKQDLQADGSLSTSLESAEPEQVIEAFKSLSTSATVKQAIDDDRLIIYPIDLLSAASKRLAGADADQSDTEFESLLETASADDGESENGFNHFLNDLTDYLNSSQYIKDFMADSVRMADELSQHTVELAGCEAAEKLLSACADLRSTIDKKHKQLEAIAKLKDMDWSGIFWHLEEEKKRLLTDLSADHTRLVGSLGLGFSAWQQTDGSWQELIDRHLQSILTNETRREANRILENIGTLLSGYSGGARLNMFQMGRLHQAGLQIEDHLQPLLKGLGQDVQVTVPELKLNQYEVPLKRSVVDMVLFRKRAKVCEKFFGAEGDKQIPAGKKRKRLTGNTEEYLKEQVDSQIREQLPELQRRYISEVLDLYQQQFFMMIDQQADLLRASVTQEISDCQANLKSLMLAIGMLEGTKVAAQNLTDTLRDIQVDFAINLATETAAVTVQPELPEKHSESSYEEAAEPEVEDFSEATIGQSDDEEVYPEFDTSVASV